MGGEYVMKKDAVNKYGANFMEAINNGKAPKQIQKFAQGGMVIQQDTENALSPAVQSAASLGNSSASAPTIDAFASAPTSSQFPSNIIDSPIQQFANGGLVIPEDEKIENAEDEATNPVRTESGLTSSDWTRFADMDNVKNKGVGPESGLRTISGLQPSPWTVKSDQTEIDFTKQVQKFAKGGMVKREEEEKKIQSGEGGFFAPGIYGGKIKGQRNLLSFASQGFTSGEKDVISSSSNQFGGASSIALEPESIRLTNRGRNQGTPLQGLTQQAKEQSFGLYGQQLEALKVYEEQKKQIKERDKAIIINGLIQLASIGAGAAAKKFDTGGKAALAAKAAEGGLDQSGNFITRAASKTSTYVKGGLFGQDVAAPDGSGQSVNVGGLKNLFNAKGNIGSSFELAKYVKQNPQSQIAKSFSQKGLTGPSLDNSGIIGASKRPRFDYLGGETLTQAQNARGRSASSALGGLGNYPGVPPQIYNGQPKEGNRSLSRDGLQYKIFDGSRWVDSFKYKGKVTGDYYGTNGPRFATGGSIPDQAGVDTVPTMLSGGEFVMNSAAANKIGQGNLERMNSGISETGSSDSESDEKLVSKLDELIAATKESSGEINITVNGSTGEEEEDSSENSSEGSNRMARKLKEEVLKIIKDEKRLGGSLRGGGL
jgi:hypothetical protein